MSVLDRDEAFRELVSEGLGEDEPDRASWLFLTRPSGWLDDLMVLVEVATEESEQAASETRLREAEKHLAATTVALESTRDELDAAERRIVELQSENDGLRSAMNDRIGEIDRLNEVNQRLRTDRERAVKNLKLTEELANTRLERIRELEATVPSEGHGAPEVEPAPDVGPAADVGAVPAGEPAPRVDAAPGIDPQMLAGPFRDTIDALERLTGALGEAALALGLGASDRHDFRAGNGESSSPADPPTDRGAVRSHTRSGERRRRPSRRTPIRLRRGAVEGSAEAIEQLLTTPGVVVLVDGYNVAMEAWPTLSKGAQRDSLIQMASTLASRSRAEIHLVFDGVGDGSRPNVVTPMPVRVHFSDADTEADDVILEMAAVIPGPVVVVTNDRRIIQGSERLGANVVTSTQMIRFVRGRMVGRDHRAPGGRP